MKESEAEKTSWASRTLTYMQTVYVVVTILAIVMGAVVHVSTSMARFDVEIQQIKQAQTRLEGQQIRDNVQSEQKLDEILKVVQGIQLELVNKQNRQ
jgi:flagellar basal body-associated protein FliL